MLSWSRFYTRRMPTLFAYQYVVWLWLDLDVSQGRP